MRASGWFAQPGTIIVTGLLVMTASVCLALAMSMPEGTSVSCYKSTMGNPDQVVMIDGDPFACTNNFTGYRCQKMVPCH